MTDKIRERVVLDPEDRRPAVIELIRGANRRVALSMFRDRKSTRLNSSHRT